MVNLWVHDTKSYLSAKAMLPHRGIRTDNECENIRRSPRQAITFIQFSEMHCSMVCCEKRVSHKFSPGTLLLTQGVTHRAYPLHLAIIRTTNQKIFWLARDQDINFHLTSAWKSGSDVILSVTFSHWKDCLDHICIYFPKCNIQATNRTKSTN